LPPSGRELLDNGEGIDEDDSWDSLEVAPALDCGTSLEAGTSPALDWGFSLDVGTSPLLDEDVVSGVISSGFSATAGGALDLSSEHAENKITRQNSTPNALNNFFIFLLPL